MKNFKNLKSSELVFKGSGSQVLTNSLLVAEKFGKEHRNVLASIRNLTAENSAVNTMFIEANYLNEQNKEQPMYIMNRDGFSLLVMGFTGEKALNFKLEFIEAFNKMEQSLKTLNIPQTFSEALRLAAEQAEKIEIQNKQIQEQAPKVAFAEAITASKSSCLIGELAKIITQNGMEIGEKRLFKWLRDNSYLGKQGERRNIPNQLYVEQGLFEVKKGYRTGRNGVLYTTTTTKVTGKGQQYFINKFLNCDVYKEVPKSEMIEA